MKQLDFEYLDQLKSNLQIKRAEMITIIREELFGVVSEKTLNTVIDYMSLSETYSLTAFEALTTIEETKEVLRVRDIENIAQNVLKISQQIDEQLNLTQEQQDFIDNASLDQLKRAEKLLDEKLLKLYVDERIASIRGNK